MGRAHCAALPLALFAALASGCWLDGTMKRRGPTVPEELGDGLAIATPESVGMDPRALEAIHARLLEPDQFRAALGLLVVKNGKLVFETYLREPADRDRVHHIQSATKTVTSLVLGAVRARPDGAAFADLDQPLCASFGRACDGLDADRRAITTRHALTMRSGVDLDNDHFALELWVDRPDEPVRYILDKPRYAAAGEKYRYRDCDPQLISYAIQAATGRNEEDWARELLFQPIGIKEWYWDPGPHGETKGPHGLFLRPRDFLRIGRVLVERGAYDGAQVVPRAWMDEAGAKQTDSGPTTPTLPYGYLTWIVPEAEGVAAWGHGGQYLFAIPAQQLLFVLVSYPDVEEDHFEGAHLAHFVDLTRPMWAAAAVTP